MRCIIALALAALAVLGPARSCPTASAGALAALPRLDGCCPRTSGVDDGAARLASTCCCAIEAPPAGVPVTPPVASASRDIAAAPPATVAPLAVVATPRLDVTALPRPPLHAPPLTLYEHRVALLS